MKNQSINNYIKEKDHESFIGKLKVLLSHIHLTYSLLSFFLIYFFCSQTLATWCEELTHWKKPWCWERLRAGEEGDDRGQDGWMASLTQWTLVWMDSGSWWWTGRPGMLQFMGFQRVWHDWVTELNWIVKLSGELTLKQGIVIHLLKVFWSTDS